MRLAITVIMATFLASPAMGVSKRVKHRKSEPAPTEMSGNVYDTNSLQNQSYAAQVNVTQSTRRAEDNCPGEYFDDYEIQGTLTIGNDSYQLIQMCYGEISAYPEYLEILAAFEFASGFKKYIWLSGTINEKNGKKMLRGSFNVGGGTYRTELEIVK